MEKEERMSFNSILKTMAWILGYIVNVYVKLC